jgi:hypothetical protein
LLFGAIRYKHIFSNIEENGKHFVVLLFSIATFLGFVVKNQLKNGFESLESFLEDRTAQVFVILFFPLSLIFALYPTLAVPAEATVKFVVYDRDVARESRHNIPGMVFVKLEAANRNDSVSTGTEATGLRFPKHSNATISQFREDGEDLFVETIPGSYSIGEHDTVIIELPVSKKLHAVLITSDEAFSNLRITNDVTHSNWAVSNGKTIELPSGKYKLLGERQGRFDSTDFNVPLQDSVYLNAKQMPPQRAQKTIRLISPQSDADIQSVIVRLTNSGNTIYVANGQTKQLEVGTYKMSIGQGERVQASDGVFRCRTKLPSIDVNRQNGELRIELVFTEKLQ